jgi:hypothetical protein
VVVVVPQIGHAPEQQWVLLPAQSCPSPRQQRPRTHVPLQHWLVVTQEPFNGTQGAVVVVVVGGGTPLFSAGTQNSNSPRIVLSSGPNWLSVWTRVAACFGVGLAL